MVKMKTIIQFGYEVHVPPNGIPLIDCRVIPNPFGIKNELLRARAVLQHPKFKELVLNGMAQLSLHDTIGVGCGWGVHRSGEVAKEIQRKILHLSSQIVEIKKL